MAKQEVRLELLLSRRVLAGNGRSIGRLEEVVAEQRGGECLISEYLVGSYGALERLSAWTIGRSVLRRGGLAKRGGYRIRWDQLDLSDPERPRLTCPVDELERFGAEPAAGGKGAAGGE